MPFARVRVFEMGSLLEPEQADVTGAVKVMLLPTTRTLMLEWAPPSLPLERLLPYRKRYHVHLGANAEAEARSRLANLGFDRGRSLRDRVRSYQRTFHRPVTGELSDAEAELRAHHDDGMMPPIVPSPTSGQGFSSLVDKTGSSDELGERANSRFSAFAAAAQAPAMAGAGASSQGAAVPGHGHVEVLVDMKGPSGTVPEDLHIVARNVHTSEVRQPSLKLELLFSYTWASFYSLPAGTWEVFASAPAQSGRRTVTVTNGSYEWIEVDLSPLVERRRLSIFSFVSRFWNKHTDKIDIAELDRLKAGRVDDFTLVHVFNPGPNGECEFDLRFKVLERRLPGKRELYLHTLSRELHRRGVQFLAGYAITDESDHAGARSNYLNLVANPGPSKELPGATANAISDHADAIVKRVREFGFDGVSFDIEIDTLVDSVHGAGARLLVTEVAKQLPIVTYFTGAFTKIVKVGDAMDHMGAFPFTLANAGPNIVALPMCFDAGGSTGYGPHTAAKVVRCVDFGLTQTTAAKIQPAIRDRQSPEDDPTLPTHVTDFGAVATEMASRGVGMAVKGTLNDMLKRAKGYDGTLSPGAEAPGKAGNPVHAPLRSDLP